MLHHDASPAGETSNGADVIINGRPGLEGPLSQLWLDYDGRWHVIAAGRASHAGEGGPWGVIAHDQGNRDAIGIETDHTTDEEWSDLQRSEALRGVHALCQRLGITTSEEIDRAVTAHKEYAPDRKVDPDPMDMDAARAKLAAYDTQGGAPVITAQKRSDEHTAVTASGWTALPFDDDGGADLFRGPAAWFAATVQVYASGPAGAKLSLRPYRKHDDGTDSDLFTIRDYVLDAQGSARCEIVQQGNLPDGQRLRISAHVATGNAAISVTAVRGQISTW
jgi:hypothetical protein